MRSPSNLFKYIIIAGTSLAAVHAVAKPGEVWKLHTGITLEDVDPLLGVEYQIPVNDHFAVVPGIDYTFVAGGDRLSANVNSRFDLSTATRNAMWAGFGIGGIRRDTRFGNDTDMGINLLWGMEFDRGGNWTPYISSKAVFADDSDFVINFGFMFGRNTSTSTATPPISSSAPSAAPSN